VNDTTHGGKTGGNRSGSGGDRGSRGGCHGGHSSGEEEEEVLVMAMVGVVNKTSPQKVPSL
jgi:hypothetical protein